MTFKPRGSLDPFPGLLCSSFTLGYFDLKINFRRKFRLLLAKRVSLRQVSQYILLRKWEWLVPLPGLFMKNKCSVIKQVNRE